jgi:hypothetical protein
MVSRFYYDCNEAFIYWLWVQKIVILCILVKPISRTTVECVAGDDSHLPVVPAGNLRIPCLDGICRAKKSHHRPALSAG